MQLLKLRYLQAKRDLGIWVFILAAIVFFMSMTAAKSSPTYGLALAAAAALALYSYHSNRKDLDFIRHYFTHPKRELLITYNLLALPVSLGLAFGLEFLTAIGLHALVSLIVLLKVKVKQPGLLFVSRFVPASQFEWISGLRKNTYVLLPLTFIAVFLSPVKLMGTAALLLLNSTFLSFYNSFEPLMLFNPESLNPNEFLGRKVHFFHRVVLFLNVPLLLINCIFQPEIAWYNACFLFGFLLLASSAVYLKYASYQPNGDLPFHLDFLFLFASALIPFLLPLAFFLNQSHKKKALQHLTHYCDDQP